MECTVTRKTKTRSEINKDYLLRIKEDEERYKKHREMKNAYNRKYKANLTEEQKQRERDRDREKKKIRDKRYREKKKANKMKESIEDREKKTLKRQETNKIKVSVQDQRKKWREAKQRERKNKKLNKILQKKSKGICKKESSKSKHPLPDSDPFQSKPAKRKALERARKALPKCPVKRAQIIKELMNNEDRKEEHNRRVGEKVDKLLTSLKKKRSKHCQKLRKLLIHLKTDSIEQLSPKELLEQATKTIKKEKKQEKEVKDFYQRMATDLPSMKSTKNGKSVAVLSQTLENLHAEYQETTGSEISRSQFCKFRPNNIRPAKKSLLNQCLCEYCQNVNLKLEVLNKLSVRHNTQSQIKHCHDGVNLVTCDKVEGKWKNDCCNRTCPDCCEGRGLDAHVEPLKVNLHLSLSSCMLVVLYKRYR